MCAGNAPCKGCAEKALQAQQGQMGYANNVLDTFGLGGLVGDKGIQATVTVKVEIPDGLWLKLGLTVIGIILLGTMSYYGIKKIIKV